MWLIEVSNVMIAIACLHWTPKLHADHDLFHIMACSTRRHDETIALEAQHEMQEPQVKQQSIFYIESVEPQLAQQQLAWHSHMMSAALPCILQSVTCSKSWKVLLTESIELGKNRAVHKHKGSYTTSWHRMPIS